MSINLLMMRRNNTRL